MSGSPPPKPDRLTPVDDASGRTVYRDPDRGTYHLWYDDAAYEPVSTAILFAVASVRGVEPDALEPLAASVEPDALNELCVHWQRRDPGPEPADGSIAFSFARCRVTVWADGEIVIDPDSAVDPDRSG